MVKVTVTKGLSLEIALSRILRENGLHVIKVHNGLITHHGKLERVKDEAWVREEIDLRPRRSGSARKKEAKEEPIEEV